MRIQQLSKKNQSLLSTNANAEEYINGLEIQLSERDQLIDIIDSLETQVNTSSERESDFIEKFEYETTEWKNNFIHALHEIASSKDQSVQEISKKLSNLENDMKVSSVTLVDSNGNRTTTTTTTTTSESLSNTTPPSSLIESSEVYASLKAQYEMDLESWEKQADEYIAEVKRSIYKFFFPQFHV